MANLIPTASDLGGINSTGELLQQVALVNWLKKQDDSSRQLLEQISTVRIVVDVWKRFSGEDQMEALRAKTILSITKYIQDNPKATKAQTTDFIAKQIQAFAQAVELM